MLEDRMGASPERWPPEDRPLQELEMTSTMDLTASKALILAMLIALGLMLGIPTFLVTTWLLSRYRLM